MGCPAEYTESDWVLAGGLAQGYDNTSSGTGGGIGQKIKQMIPGELARGLLLTQSARDCRYLAATCGVSLRLLAW